MMATLQVYPGATNPSHEISLSDGVLTWGLRLDGGAQAVKETPITPSTLRLSGVSGFGAWEPGLAQIEQSDWSGGRGAERFSTKSASRYFESHNAWTLSPGRLHPAPQWRFAQGLRSAVHHLPGDVSWRGLLGASRYLAAGFTLGAASLAAKRAQIWVRKVGNPGGLNLSLFSDSGGAPGAQIAGTSTTLRAVEVVDVVSELRGFDLSAMSGSLSAATSYHLVLGASANDNAANHWELAVRELIDGGHASADGASWSAVNCQPYFRIEDAALVRNFIFFRLGGAQYAVDQRANGTPSHVYLNGERGVATGFSATHIDDMHKLWADDVWAGAWVRIMKGKGAGQAREILSNGPGDLQVTAWDVLPDATSEYLIYATDVWQDISPQTGDLIDGMVRDVAIVNDHAIFAQGDAVPLLRMRFNSALATPAHEFDDDGTNMADLLHVFHHPLSGPQLWRGLIGVGEVSRAAPANWLTAMTFGTAIKVGERSQPLRELFDWNSQLWILKGDGFWQVNDSDQAKRVNLGLESNGRDWGAQPLLTWNGQIIFAWGPAVLASSGSSLADIGPLASAGLPAARAGCITGLAALGASRLACAIDAGDGFSSVLIWDGETWHEVMRAPQAGRRAGNLAWQECPGSQPRLWVCMNGELICIALPRDAQDPLNDGQLSFQHEAVLVGSTVDMEAPRLPKFLREVSLLSSNLGADAQVALDYQLDAEIGGEVWRQAGVFSASPLDTLPLNIGPLHALRPRLRLLSSKASQPPIVDATVVDGFARTPLRYQWELSVVLAGVQADSATEGSADEFVTWLQAAAKRAARIQMRSVWAALDQRYVLFEPPVQDRESGLLTLRVREG